MAILKGVLTTILVSLVPVVPAAHAIGLLPEFYYGARAVGMGNAFTAIADDADAVFYNPAGIAFNSGVQLRLLNPKFDMSTDNLKIAKELRSLGSSGFDSDAFKALFGKNIYANATIYPSVMIPHLTIGYYAGFNFHAVTNNLALPRIDLSYYYDQGIVGGTGFESRGFGRLHRARYGLTVKGLSRRGVSRTLPVTQLATGSAVLKSLTSDAGIGVGLDFGLQYDIPVTSSTVFVLGGAWQDIGDTKFGNRSTARRPPSQKSNLSSGGAVIFNLSKRNAVDVKIAAEGRHLNRTGEDWRKKTHLGTELMLGYLSFRAGLNQLRWTAGATLDLFFLEATVASYAVEALPLWGQATERRYLAQLTFKLDASGPRNRGIRDSERRKRPRLYK